MSAAGLWPAAGALGCSADGVSVYFCLLHGTSAKLGGRGGGRISLRLLQAKIEHDLFSSAAINTFLSNNPSYSSQPGAQESQVMSEAQTAANQRQEKGKKMSFPGLPTVSNLHSCSICGAHHVLCTCFAVTEFSPQVGEAPLYFSVIPYGVIKTNGKGYTQKTHELRNTRLLQVRRTADSKGLLRIKRKMSSSPAGQLESC